MKFYFLLALLLFSYSVHAGCPVGKESGLSLKDRNTLIIYKGCAEGMNDDFSQAQLASFYDKGAKSTARDFQKALYYYQLSAENGNAVSQARLAQLYMDLDQDIKGRQILHDYLNSVVIMDEKEGGKNIDDDVWVNLMHPYVLLLLATEKVENKWYYPTEEKQAPAYAKNLLGQYKIDAARKNSFIQQAAAWKQKKLLETAQEVLSAQEYQDFVEGAQAKDGLVDDFKRNQLVKMLQEKVQKKKEQDAVSAQTLY